LVPARAFDVLGAELLVLILSAGLTPAFEETCPGAPRRPTTPSRHLWTDPVERETIANMWQSPYGFAGIFIKP
jgi:hypothetical protein